ncbi:hypothetical protein HRI_001015700 [Hibiscus trionum]|uniref:Response regulatory domain-containing protein n=1 Tax=Hibiscus trionum TaxID=183268 RepID=A0A9W7H9K8_HIBTR|nr:hypothetical protein HRI_001015700 [Hibiscus trionum]
MEQLSRCGGGLSVLVVDQDTTALMYLASLLEQCSYYVTTTELASVAISMIRGGRGGNERFRLVIADINMDEANSLALLRISVMSKIPVILMSTERSHAFAEKVIGYGACSYLQKPISLNDVKYLWQHVYRRPRVSVAKREAYLRGIGLDPKGKNKEVVPTDDRRMLAVATGGEGEKHGAGGSKMKTPYRDEEGTRNGNENGVALDPNRPFGPRARKSRLVWSKELHHKFAAAINALGDDKARPMQILKMMNEPNLTHRQVASHLQKHKAQMKRMSGASPRNSASNIMNASTSLFPKRGFFFMPQTPQLGLGSTASVGCFNQNQPWQQKLNYGLRFNPISSMNRTLQFPAMPEPTGNLGNQFQNHIWSQPTRGADKSQTEMDSRAASVPEKWNRKQTERLVDLLKVLDEETDDYVGSAIEPHPAEVERFCELLKEAMLGNEQNP